MANEKKSFFAHPLFVGILSAIVGSGATYIFTPKNNDAEKIIGTMTNQNEVLKSGFNQVVMAVEKSGAINSKEVNVTLNNYVTQLANFTKQTNEINSKYNKSATLLDTSFIKIAPPKVDSRAEAPLEVEEVIQIALGDKTAKRLNIYNQIAVVEEFDIDGKSGIKVNQNNHTFPMYPADVRPMLGDDKKQVRLVYDGKGEGYYKFRFIKH